ncbi:MAG: CinA family protein [Longispora sp.]|nr:CinA family protein [Longispora sp. (in: high G+C Gram-positive bacteria)]
MTVHAALTARGLTLATAESLTGGLVGHLITSIPGASGYYRGGIVAYATEVKSSVLGVDALLLGRYGPVSPQVATAMATAARELFAADIGLSTTGVAGPIEQDGQPVGTLFIGISGPFGTQCVALRGDAAEGRNSIRAWAAGEALNTLGDALSTPDTTIRS